MLNRDIRYEAQQTSAEPPQMAEVHRECNAAEIAASELHACIDQLTDRLKSVLCPTPVAVGNEPKEPNPGSPLATAIKANTTSIAFAGQRLRDLMCALAV